MRWLFWVLVLVNLIGFYWFGLSSDHRASKNSPQSLAVGNGPGLDKTTLVLVGEVNTSKPEISKATLSTKAPIKNDEDILVTVIDAAEPEPEPEPEPEAAVDVEEPEASLAVVKSDEIKECVLVGPLSDESSALELKEVLVSEQIVAELHEESSAIKEDYWMIIPPFDEKSEAKALLRELQQRDIDSYIISEGEYQNGITLGVFGDAENTKKYQNEMKALGYSVEVKPLPRAAKIFWLELSGLNASEFKDNGQEINEKKVAQLSALVRQKLSEQKVADQVNISEIVCGIGVANSGLASHTKKSTE